MEVNQIQSEHESKSLTPRNKGEDSKRELIRLDSRMRFEDLMRNYLNSLREKKNVIYCGDLNVAHKEIDLKNPKPNRGHAGFTDEEREKFTNVVSADLVDTFRHFYPDLEGAYSWWSYRFNSRAKNAGWRIDYFVASKRLQENIKDATIHNEIFGSDHCPVGLELE